MRKWIHCPFQTQNTNTIGNLQNCHPSTIMINRYVVGKWKKSIVLHTYYKKMILTTVSYFATFQNDSHWNLKRHTKDKFQNWQSKTTLIHKTGINICKIKIFSRNFFKSIVTGIQRIKRTHIKWNYPTTILKDIYVHNYKMIW